MYYAFRGIFSAGEQGRRWQLVLGGLAGERPERKGKKAAHQKIASGDGWPSLTWLIYPSPTMALSTKRRR